MNVPNIKLNSGIEIPSIGFGPGGIGYSPKMPRQRSGISGFCFKAYNKFIYRPLQKEKYINAVSNAFKLGYSLLDDSDSYNNFPQVRKAWEKAGLNREDLFITSRVDNRVQIAGNVREKFFQTLRALNTDYLDLYQFHWPVTGYYVETWKEIIHLKNEGYIRIIGVANCHEHHLDTLFRETGIMPEINQIEVHPLFTQKPLLAYCKIHNIQVESYTPIARFDDRLVRLPLLKKIARHHGKTIVQVILRWHIQNGLIPIIRSLNKKRQLENISIFDFELSKDEMESIDGININARVRYDPDNCDFTIL